MDKNLKEPQERAMQYWFADGLVELSGGVLCLLLAIYFSLQQILPASNGYFAALFLLVFIAAFGVRRLMLWIRGRSTYPRTGYVEPKKTWKDRRMLGIAIGFTVLLLAFMLFTILHGIQTLNWMPTIGGFIFAFLFGMAAHETKSARFYYLAGYSLLLGVFLSLNYLGDLWGEALLSLGTSLVLFAFGTVTRLNYLRQVSATMEQADDR